MELTVSELIGFFQREGILDDAYSLYADKDDAYCLIRQENEWLVYFSERGCRYELGWGKTEPQGLNLLRIFVLNGLGRFSSRSQA